MKKPSLKTTFDELDAKLHGVPTLSDMRSFRRLIERTRESQGKLEAKLKPSLLLIWLKWLLAIAALSFCAGVVLDAITFHFINWAYLVSAVLSFIIALGEFLV